MSDCEVVDFSTGQKKVLRKKKEDEKKDTHLDSAYLRNGIDELIDEVESGRCKKYLILMIDEETNVGSWNRRMITDPEKDHAFSSAVNSLLGAIDIMKATIVQEMIDNHYTVSVPIIEPGDPEPTTEPDDPEDTAS